MDEEKDIQEDEQQCQNKNVQSIKNNKKQPQNKKFSSPQSTNNGNYNQIDNMYDKQLIQEGVEDSKNKKYSSPQTKKNEKSYQQDSVYEEKLIQEDEEHPQNMNFSSPQPIKNDKFYQIDSIYEKKMIQEDMDHIQNNNFSSPNLKRPVSQASSNNQQQIISSKQRFTNPIQRIKYLNQSESSSPSSIRMKNTLINIYQRHFQTKKDKSSSIQILSNVSQSSQQVAADNNYEVDNLSKFNNIRMRLNINNKTESNKQSQVNNKTEQSLECFNQYETHQNIKTEQNTMSSEKQQHFHIPISKNEQNFQNSLFKCKSSSRIKFDHQQIFKNELINNSYTRPSWNRLSSANNVMVSAIENNQLNDDKRQIKYPFSIKLDGFSALMTQSLLAMDSKKNFDIKEQGILKKSTSSMNYRSNLTKEESSKGISQSSQTFQKNKFGKLYESKKQSLSFQSPQHLESFNHIARNVSSSTFNQPDLNVFKIFKKQGERRVVSKFEKELLINNLNYHI